MLDRVDGSYIQTTASCFRTTNVSFRFLVCLCEAAFSSGLSPSDSKESSYQKYPLYDDVAPGSHF